jgi:hypothetical protein
LYKLKTAKVFEKPRSRSVDGVDEDPFAIQLISLCPESRKLCVAGASSHVVLFKFRKLESVSETAVSLSQSKKEQSLTACTGMELYEKVTGLDSNTTIQRLRIIYLFKTFPTFTEPVFTKATI